MNILNRAVATPLLVLTLLLSSSALFVSCSQHGQAGAGVGAGLGALAGALIDDDNRWRGAAVGGALGGVFGGTLAEVSSQASREAAYEGRPVTYESQDGYRRVEATPVNYNAQTDCHKVRERVWEGDKLVKDQVKEVCESSKSEPGYY